MKKVHAFAPLGAFAALLALCAVPLLKETDPSVAPSALIGRPVPAFSLPPALSGGKGFGDADLKADGRPKLVNVFSSWCLTCAAEQRVLTRLAASDGVPVYGIDYKDERKKVAGWLKRNGNPYRKIGFDGDGRAAIDWGVSRVPETFVVDGEGVVRYRHAGPVTEQDYKDILQPLLTEARE